MNDFDVTAFSNALADAAETALKSVVTVWGAQSRPISGVVVRSGEVLTVEHVLMSDTVTVQWEGERLEGTVTGRDAATDLALVKVSGLNAPAIDVGEAARLGSIVLAVAKPGGSPMVSSGVVSGEAHGAPRGPRRRSSGRGVWIRTDAAPYPGFSGSALVNARGALVGLVNAGVSRGEILAVPVARAMEVATSLSAHGSTPRGFLGVNIQEVKLETGNVGLLVLGVESGSPAAAALLLGDVLLTWNGEALDSGGALMERVTSGANETVVLGVLRGGQPLGVQVTLGARER
ncbi:S1C family serine protease [Deinococcus yavapaiensis]|uniref:S1-C subfamily serine protease n=1 Tax=Deinococcus yavapaiensis KR-236 TaxID=694435 RepID=A0A318S1M4_9DEIO|nr:trypsin-like peptidase domain-containing protein [Deinococcus yavapaiensis]PYE51816.1 S1-C subfamily serine protease [Deinococcus yavapaiensis KR-236]